MNGTRTSGNWQDHVLAAPALRYAHVWSDWWFIPVSVLGALVVIWLLLVAALWLTKPANVGVEEYLLLLPDLVRLLKGIATDPEMPRRIQIAMFALLAFVASPIDLIPDIIPVIGLADDVILIALVLRWVIHTADESTLAKHWPGTPEGLSAVRRLFGATEPREPG